jgi:hypothetical protein
MARREGKQIVTAEIKVFDPASREEVWREVDTGVEFHLRPAPGATSIHVLIRVGEENCLRAEVRSPSADLIPMRILQDAGKIDISADSGSRVYYLPLAAKYDPPKPILMPQSQKIDILYLLDGTARALKEKEPREAWTALVNQLLGFAQQAKNGGRDLRLGMIAFGDDPLDELADSVEFPFKYKLRPSQIRDYRPLQDYTIDQVRADMLKLEYTSGGDMVDALAEGLGHAQEAGWRLDAKKVVLLAGDSPGYSILHPPEASGISHADVRIRKTDVDDRAGQLYEKGVVVLTLCLAESGANKPSGWVDYTHDQYRRIAAMPSFGWAQASFNPEQAFQMFDRLTADVLARGSYYGLAESS